MKRRRKVNRMLLFFLTLHTSTVALFVYIAAESGILPAGLPLTVSIVLFSALITAYTAYRISRLVAREIADGLNAVSLASTRLKYLSEEMYGNAKELERRVGAVSACANTAEDLLKKLDAADDGFPDKKSSGTSCSQPIADISEHKIE